MLGRTDSFKSWGFQQQPGLILHARRFPQTSLTAKSNHPPASIPQDDSSALIVLSENEQPRRLSRSSTPGMAVLPSTRSATQRAQWDASCSIGSCLFPLTTEASRFCFLKIVLPVCLTVSGIKCEFCQSCPKVCCHIECRRAAQQDRHWILACL